MAITTLNNRSINRSDTASAGQVWTATSATAADFQAAAAGGKIGQVISATNTTGSTATPGSTFTNITGLSCAITPAATNSKILIVYSVSYTASGPNNSSGLRIARGGTGISISDAINSVNRTTSTTLGYDYATRFGTSSMNYLDSPSSTSELTYTIQWISPDSATLYLNSAANQATTNANDIRSVSALTVMEVLA